MLDEMASYLAANDIRFVVIVTPHRSDVGSGYEDEYEMIDTYLGDFVSKRGGIYHNLDADPELRQQLGDDMFMDGEHIVDVLNIRSVIRIFPFSPGSISLTRGTPLFPRR